MSGSRLGVKTGCMALLAVLSFIGLASLSKSALADDEIRYFGIVPQQAASRLAKIWIPFMRRLSAETGLNIRFATMKDIPTFEQCLAQGAYDFAYMNPYHYTTFSAQSGYRAFAHQSEKRLRGILVVRKDNPAAGLVALNQQKIAFPSPAAFGASVLPRAEMRALGMEITPVYVKSHDSVYRGVVSGLFPAGGGVLRTFGAIPKAMQDQLRIIYQTDAYTAHAFAAAPTVDDSMRQQVADAMASIEKDAPDLVKNLGMRGFDLVGDDAWDDVRALNLTRAQTEIADQGAARCRSD